MVVRVMSDNPASRPPPGRLSARFSLRRALVYAGTSAYCLALFLAFDFAWSSLTRGEETQRPARVAPDPDHPHEGSQGQVCRERQHHGPGEVAEVPGAHEDTVGDEDVAGDELTGGGDEEGGHGIPLHGGVGGDKPGDRAGREREEGAEEDAVADAPAEHRADRGARGGEVTRAEVAADDCLGGDGEGVDGEGEDAPDRRDDLVRGQGSVTQMCCGPDR